MYNECGNVKSRGRPNDINFFAHFLVVINNVHTVSGRRRLAYVALSYQVNVDDAMSCTLYPLFSTNLPLPRILPTSYYLAVMWP